MADIDFSIEELELFSVIAFDGLKIYQEMYSTGLNALNMVDPDPWWADKAFDAQSIKFDVWLTSAEDFESPVSAIEELCIGTRHTKIELNVRQYTSASRAICETVLIAKKAWHTFAVQAGSTRLPQAGFFAQSILVETLPKPSDLSAELNREFALARAELRRRGLLSRETHPPRPPSSSVSPIEKLRNAQWKEIGIVIEKNLTAIITGPKKFEVKLGIQQMGMVDGRTGEPDDSWELLVKFAAKHGVLVLTEVPPPKVSQSGVSKLRKKLRSLIPIAASPIEFDATQKTYRTVFSARGDHPAK